MPPIPCGIPQEAVRILHTEPSALRDMQRKISIIFAMMTGWILTATACLMMSMANLAWN